MTLAYKKALVIGGGRGTGKALAVKLAEAGVETTVVGRNSAPLEQLRNERSEINILALDVSKSPGAARDLLAEYRPDLLAVVGGTQPKVAPITDQSWEEFSATWNNDVKSAFEFTCAALKLPLEPGATIVSFSSGASLNGSYLSGGYAGAKRMQTFLVNYGQREADRAELGLRFISILPKQLMQNTEIGSAASAAYAESAGISREQFMQQWEKPLTPELAASLVLSLLEQPADSSHRVFTLTGIGVEAID